MSTINSPQQSFDVQIERLSDETAKRVNLLIRSKAASMAPETPKELWNYIKILHNVEIPVTSVTEGNDIPMQWIWDFYTEKYPFMFAVGSRGGSKTWPSAILTDLKCRTRDKYEAMHVAAIKKQAEVYSDYIRGFYLDETLGKGYRKQPARYSAEWKSNSSYKIITGSIGGVCLSAETSVITDIGAIPIHKLVYHKMPVKVLSFNKVSRKLEWKKVIGWHNNGKGGEFVRPQFSRKFRAVTGSMTMNHKLVLSDGSKKALSDITDDDSVLFRDYVFSADQHQVILGSILGDGSIDKLGRMSFAHGAKQIYYGDWKINAFLDFRKTCRLFGGGEATSGGHNAKGGFSKTDCKYYHVPTNSAFYDYRKNWYPEGKKIVYEEDLYKMEKLGLAIWIMDDGSISKTRKVPKLDIYTNGFSFEDNEKLVKWFNWKLGVTPSISRDTRNAYYLTFTTDDSDIVLDYVKEYVTRKTDEVNVTKKWNESAVIEDGHLGVVEAKLVSIEPSNLKDTRRYDLTVEDNHNFVLASGLVVSNSGNHPVQLTLDEIEFWDIPALEQSFAVPQPKNGYSKLWCAFSTRQRAFGASSYLTSLVESGEKDIKLYQWNIFETMRPCRTCDCIVGDRVDSSKCNLWSDCEGHRGLKCTGWVPVEEVRQLRATLDRRQWEVQYLCTRPSSHGLVLFNFEHEYCTTNNFDYGNYFRYTYDPALPLYVTHDPAEGNKSVAIFWQVVALSDSNYKIFVFDELIIPKCPNTLAMKQAVFEHCVKEGYGMPATVYVDPHKADSQADWRMGSPIGEGINRSFNADMPDMTTGYVLVEPGLGLLRGFLCDPGGKRHLYVHPEKCRGLVMAIKEHHYKLDNNNELGVEPKPDPAFKDEIDTLRYTVISVVTKMGKKIPGVSRSMKFISL